MRTLATPTRRRPHRGAECEDAPRLWGSEPAVPADASSAAPAVAPAAAAAGAPPIAAAVTTAAAPATQADRSASAIIEAEAIAPGETAGPTLDDLISGAWDGLSAGSPASCPVCPAEMRPRWSAGAGVVGGRCGGCGTTIE